MTAEQTILAAHVVCWVILVPAVFATLFCTVSAFVLDKPGEARFPIQIALVAFTVVCVALFGVVATW